MSAVRPSRAVRHRLQIMASVFCLFGSFFARANTMPPNISALRGHNIRGLAGQSDDAFSDGSVNSQKKAPAEAGDQLRQAVTRILRY